jgi:tetratricopeptide (TPR) repeat protein
MEAARETFHRIYKNGERSDLVSSILEQLDFHPLSTALLATVAHHNKWNVDRLSREWEMQRTGLLRTRHNESLAAAIELSLASPTFKELGPNARDLLGVIAFFPQGVDKNNLDWFFPSIPNRRDVFDQLCALSLTYQSNGFITMLAPLRDHLRPRDPTSSPLLGTTKECYLRRLSVDPSPGSPDYEEARWIVSEDVNVEHLLDVFTSVDLNSDSIWGACAEFMSYLRWHKPRLVVLGPKLEGLPDNHPFKPGCLSRLSGLLDVVGNPAECKRLLAHSLKLWREQGNDFEVAATLNLLAYSNERLHILKEGISQAKESVEIFKRLNNPTKQANSLQMLARLLCYDKQFDAAEEATSRSISLLNTDSGNQFTVCKSHYVLGDIYRFKGEAEKAINHLETALGIAPSFNWHGQQFSILCSLAQLFLEQGRFGDAHTHAKRAKLHTVNDTYNMGLVMKLRADIWYQQGKLKKARSEALCSVDAFGELGAAKDVEDCMKFLRRIEEKMDEPVSFSGWDSDSELLKTLLVHLPVNSPFADLEAERRRRRCTTLHIYFRPKDAPSHQLVSRTRTAFHICCPIICLLICSMLCLPDYHVMFVSLLCASWAFCYMLHSVV